MRYESDNAVSPVVGVMLMLVVTIIIAAVVSAFAGGIGTSETKVPQVTLSADYSIADGMAISHNGGDTLTIGDFRVLLTPSRNFASIESDAYVNELDQSLFANGQSESATHWYLAGNGRRMVNRFATGDVAYISAADCATEKLTPNLYVSSYGVLTNNGINQSQYIGATFFLDFVTKDGKRITRLEVPIKP